MKCIPKSFAYCLLGLLAILTACNKQGPTGPTGLTGTNGTNGTNGAVNVINQYITITPSQLTWDSTANQWFYKYGNMVNLASISNAAVLVYVESANGYEATPYTNFKQNYTVSFANDLNQSNPYVRFEYFNGTATCPLPSGNLNVQLVIIPPARMIPNINYGNFPEVKAAYKL